MRAVLREVQVEVGANGQPRRVLDGGRRLTVHEVLDAWRAGARWWLAEPCRDCWTLSTSLGIIELHREDAPGSRWWLTRVQD